MLFVELQTKGLDLASRSEAKHQTRDLLGEGAVNGRRETSAPNQRPKRGKVGGVECERHLGGGDGGGLFIGGVGSTEVVGNSITDNTGVQGAGGGMALFAAGTPVIQGNLIARNRSYGQGGAMWIVNLSDALISGNVIRDNVTGQEGGGVYWGVPLGGRGPYLLHNVITGNAGSAGAGLFAIGYQSGARAADNFIEAHNGASAVTCSALYGRQLPQLSNNIVRSVGAPPYSGCGIVP